MHVAFTSPVLWLNILLISGFCGLIEYFILSFFFVFKKSTVTILQRLYNEPLTRNIEKNNKTECSKYTKNYSYVNTSRNNLQNKNS